MVCMYVDWFERVSVVGLVDVLVGLGWCVGCVVDRYEEICGRVNL